MIISRWEEGRKEAESRAESLSLRNASCQKRFQSISHIYRGAECHSRDETLSRGRLEEQLSPVCGKRLRAAASFCAR